MAKKLEKRNCLECGKVFEVTPSRKKLFCTHFCYSESVKRQPKKQASIKICLICKVTFERRYLNGTDSTCSRKCSIKRANEIESQKRRLPNNKCHECGEMFHPLKRQQKSCSRKCANKIKARISGENHPLWKPKVLMNCEICGQEKEVKPSLVSRFRACSKRCAAIIAQIQMPRVSSIEVKMQNLFQEAELKFQPQFVIGQYITDFAFEREKLVVECDGDYWHNLPKAKAKDRRKDGFLKHNGWRVLRIWEHEINENPKNCLVKVLEALDKH